MNTIATLQQLQQYLNLSSGDDDARLIDALQTATTQMERLAGRRFCPRVASIDHTVDPDDPTELLLDDDLLALDSLTSNDGSTISISDALLIPGDDLPTGIVASQSCCTSSQSYCTVSQSCCSKPDQNRSKSVR